jgi:hypothetical protein
MELGADEARISRESSDIDEEGFDISLIRETLRMSPDERLNWHQGLVRVIEELRHAIKHSRATLAEKNKRRFPLA